MKKFYSAVLLLFTVSGIMAQSNKQVQWAFSAKKIADKIYELHMTANIGGNYHMYAQDAGVEGPLPTAFSFVKNPLAAFDGKPKESGHLVKKFESAWNGNVRYYEKSVEFVQLVKLKANVKTNLAGAVEFMVCNDTQCLPPSTLEFKVNVGG